MMMMMMTMITTVQCSSVHLVRRERGFTEPNWNGKNLCWIRTCAQI